MKYGDCIRCGWCCRDFSCGLSNKEPCKFLSQDEDGIHSCEHYPFTHLDTFTRMCLEAGTGCGNGGENPDYRRLWVKLKKMRDVR